MSSGSLAKGFNESCVSEVLDKSQGISDIDPSGNTMSDSTKGDDSPEKLSSDYAEERDKVRRTANLFHDELDSSITYKRNEPKRGRKEVKAEIRMRVKEQLEGSFSSCERRLSSATLGSYGHGGESDPNNIFKL